MEGVVEEPIAKPWSLVVYPDYQSTNVTLFQDIGKQGQGGKRPRENFVAQKENETTTK